MYRVYGDIQSGNCYKVKLMLVHLGLAHTWEHVDIMKGESRTAEFLARNPNGRVPVIRLPDGRFLAESNAILAYLADGSAYLPGERYARGKVFEWLFFEQYSHEPFIATARYIAKYLGLPETRRAEYEGKQKGGHAALGVMERTLARQNYLVGDSMTIADIALYAYSHVAHEGGFSLDAYPGVRRWLERIAAHPTHRTMEAGA
jgi:glutathione S-transferase